MFRSYLVQDSTEDPVALWLHQLKCPDPTIEEKFREYWRISVPRLYAPMHGKTSIDQRFDADKIQRVLLDPLGKLKTSSLI